MKSARFHVKSTRFQLNCQFRVLDNIYKVISKQTKTVDTYITKNRRHTVARQYIQATIGILSAY